MSWLTHLVGSVVRLLLDYVSHVSICPVLKRILKGRPEWEEISDILSKTSNPFSCIRAKAPWCWSMGILKNALSYESLFVCLCISRQASVPAALVSTGNQRPHEPQDSEWPWSHGRSPFSSDTEKLSDLQRIQPVWWPLLNMKLFLFIQSIQCSIVFNIMKQSLWL